MTSTKSMIFGGLFILIAIISIIATFKFVNPDLFSFFGSGSKDVSQNTPQKNSDVNRISESNPPVGGGSKSRSSNSKSKKPFLNTSNIYALFIGLLIGYVSSKVSVTW